MLCPVLVYNCPVRRDVAQSSWGEILALRTLGCVVRVGYVSPRGAAASGVPIGVWVGVDT